MSFNQQNLIRSNTATITINSNNNTENSRRANSFITANSTFDDKSDGNNDHDWLFDKSFGSNTYNSIKKIKSPIKKPTKSKEINYTDKLLNIYVLYPHKHQLIPVVIPINTDLTGLKRLLIRKLGIVLALENITLYLLDYNQINQRINDELYNDNECKSNDIINSSVVYSIRIGKYNIIDYNNLILCNINILRNNYIIYFGTIDDSYRPLTKLYYLYASNESKEIMYKKYLQLLDKNYIGFRSIKGDGNCYYRAIIYGLIEQLIIKKDYKRINYLYLKFKNMVYQNSKLNNMHKVIVDFLHDASCGKKWVTVDEFDTDFLNPTIDLPIIRACRHLVSKFILKYRQIDVNGITLGDSILHSYPENKNLNDYCESFIERMGVDAEGPAVNLGILLHIFKCKGSIVFLDNVENTDIQILECNYDELDIQKLNKINVNVSSFFVSARNIMRQNSKISKSNSFISSGGSMNVSMYSIAESLDNEREESELTEIHLLLRPGHYDLLYTNDSIVLSNDRYSNYKDHPLVYNNTIDIPTNIPTVELAENTIDETSRNNNNDISINNAIDETVSSNHNNDVITNVTNESIHLNLNDTSNPDIQIDSNTVNNDLSTDDVREVNANDVNIVTNSKCGFFSIFRFGCLSNSSTADN